MFLDWIAQNVLHAVVGAVMPIYDFLLDGSSRYYWLYAATGLLIAAYVYRRNDAATGFKATLLDREVWMSRSALNDYILVVLTPVLRVTVLSVLAVNWRQVSDFMVSLLHGLGVSGDATDQTAVALGLVLTVALFIADDFLRWWVHYEFHRIPELWEFHKVHHSAEVLNFATAERHHPVEVVITAAILTIGYGAVNGLFIGLFGDKLTVMTIAGANVFLVAFNICGGVLRHSPFWISFGPKVERWVISPAMHQIHHSAKEHHYDRNMGGSLTIWDRWAGTLHIPNGREIDEFGIGAETKDFRSLETILVRPFQAALALLGRRAGLGSKADEASRPEAAPAAATAQSNA